MGAASRPASRNSTLPAIQPRPPEPPGGLGADTGVTVEFYGGRRIEVEARTLSGDDREAAWARIEREAPEYAKYLEKTDREIPVVRLTAR